MYCCRKCNEVWLEVLRNMNLLFGIFWLLYCCGILILHLLRRNLSNTAVDFRINLFKGNFYANLMLLVKVQRFNILCPGIAIRNYLNNLTDVC